MACQSGLSDFKNHETLDPGFTINNSKTHFKAKITYFQINQVVMYSGCNLIFTSKVDLHQHCSIQNSLINLCTVQQDAKITNFFVQIISKFILIQIS
jgi:hypothetical protein